MQARAASWLALALAGTVWVAEAQAPAAPANTAPANTAPANTALANTALANTALATTAPATAVQADPQLARAHLQQELLPALEARRLAARAQVEAARKYFASARNPEAASWTSAFPQLDGAPLGDAAFLSGARLDLQRRAAARASERVAPPPEGLDAAGLKRWRSAVAAACDAEDEADSLQDRFLGGLATGLERAPGWRQESVAAQLATWRALRQLPAGLGTDDPRWQEAASQAALAGKLEARLERYRRAAWRAMTVPEDGDLAGPLQPQQSIFLRLIKTRLSLSLYQPIRLISMALNAYGG